jgi:hypothetical protein
LDILSLQKKTIQSALLLLMFAYIADIKAQETIPATGGKGTGIGGTTSYSVGQIVYTTNISVSNGSVTQGVQHPYEISVVTATEQAKGINLSCSAYLNPTTDLLTLKVENFKLSTH